MKIDIMGDMASERKVRRYVEKTITSLERFAGKRDWQDGHAEVVLSLANRPHGNKYEAEVRLHLNDETLTATDSTLNVLAALDIVRAKLARELKKEHSVRLPRA